PAENYAYRTPKWRFPGMVPCPPPGQFSDKPKFASCGQSVTAAPLISPQVIGSVRREEDLGRTSLVLYGMVIEFRDAIRLPKMEARKCERTRPQEMDCDNEVKVASCSDC